MWMVRVDMVFVRGIQDRTKQDGPYHHRDCPLGKLGHAWTAAHAKWTDQTATVANVEDLLTRSTIRFRINQCGQQRGGDCTAGAPTTTDADSRPHVRSDSCLGDCPTCHPAIRNGSESVPYQTRRDPQADADQRSGKRTVYNRGHSIISQPAVHLRALPGYPKERQETW